MLETPETTTGPQGDGCTIYTDNGYISSSNYPYHYDDNADWCAIFSAIVSVDSYLTSFNNRNIGFII